MRIVTKIGEIFLVKLENSQKYFQYIANDMTQLNSSVIRAFEEHYPLDSLPNLTEIVKGKIEFYAHVVLRWGIELGYWEKIGKNPEIGELNHILFRDTNDYGKWVNDEPIKISQNWYVWNINEKFRDVGKLVGENRKAEIGVVIAPIDIYHRIKTGKYSYFYPGFE